MTTTVIATLTNLKMYLRFLGVKASKPELLFKSLSETIIFKKLIKRDKLDFMRYKII